MEERKFYRVGNIENNQGLWYDIDGNFTGLIHDKFSFCKNRDLPMPFSKEIKGYLSVTETLDDLFNWFSEKDIKRLYDFGYRILEYTSKDYKVYNNHWIINQKNYTNKKIIEL